MILRVYYYKALERVTVKYRGVEQLVARRAHNPKVVGSSPPSATRTENTHRKMGVFRLEAEIKGLTLDFGVNKTNW